MIINNNFYNKRTCSSIMALNLFWDIVERRYVFNLRMAENECLLMASVAGLTRMSLSNITTSEKKLSLCRRKAF